MVRNQEKLEQAVLFRKRGFTLEEIARICGVSKSTASKWLKNKAFSEEITKQNKRRAGQENAKRLQLMSKTRSRERTLRYKEVERLADVEFRNYIKDPRFMAGLMAYAASGDLTSERVIRLSSSKILIHKAFVGFAEAFLGVERSKVRFWLLLYSSHVEEVCMKKWHKGLGLPYSQFYQNHIVRNDSKKPPLHDGVGNTIIGSTVLKRKLKRWLELLKKEI